LTFIQGVLINTYGWEVYTSLSLDLYKTYAFSDASKYCIFSDYSQAWLQVTELICIELQQVLFLKQLGCSQSNHVKSRSSTKYTTIQIIQLIATAVTACGGINTIEGVLHNVLGMSIKPFVTLGRSTSTAPNLVCNAIFNSIVVDHSECENATLFNIGITSKPVHIFVDLEDKIIFRGFGNNDMIHVVLVQCLSTNILCNEKTIGDNKVVEVENEMMERIRHKRMLLSSWSDALEFYHVQIMDPLGVDSLNSQIFITHYHDYYIVGNGTWWQIKTKNMLTHSQFEKVCAWDNPYSVSFIIGTDINDLGKSLLLVCVLFMRRIHAIHSLKLGQVLWSSFYCVFAHMDQVNNDSELNVICTDSKVGHASTCDLFPISCAHFEQWDPGRYLAMCTTVWSFKFKQWDPGKVCVVSNFYNLEDKVDLEGVGNDMTMEVNRLHLEDTVFLQDQWNIMTQNRSNRI
jgi:hypothetical protein